MSRDVELKPIGVMDLIAALVIFFGLCVIAVYASAYLSQRTTAEGQDAVDASNHKCESCVDCCVTCNVKDECCCRHPGHKCTCPKPPKDPVHPSRWRGPEDK